MVQMRVRLKRMVFDGRLTCAVVYVVARATPITTDSPSVRVSVRIPISPNDTLAAVRRRARDEALKFLDVA